jgi:hypothetical protein
MIAAPEVDMEAEPDIVLTGDLKILYTPYR